MKTMKTIKTIKILAFIALFISFTSCSKEDDSPVLGDDTIEFEGSFGREFDVQGTTQKVTYTIDQNKINYDLAGEQPMSIIISKKNITRKMINVG